MKTPPKHQKLLTSLFTALSDKIVEVSLEFSGSNNAEFFSEVTYVHIPTLKSKLKRVDFGKTILRGGEYQIPNRGLSIYNPQTHDWDHGLANPTIDSFIKETSLQILNQRVPGWKRGKGSVGTITFLIKDEEVNIKHEWCEQ
jgi:hypothetical protein